MAIVRGVARQERDAFALTALSDQKAGAAATRSGGVRVDHSERGADQVIDEIEFRACQKRHRSGIDQHHRALARDHEVVLGPGPFDVEFVLEAGAAAALDADAQHRAVAFALEDFPDAAGGPLADGDGSSHDMVLHYFDLSTIFAENRYPLFRIVLHASYPIH